MNDCTVLTWLRNGREVEPDEYDGDDRIVEALLNYSSLAELNDSAKLPFTDIAMIAELEWPSINKDWLAALRSGNYRQAAGLLSNGDGHCCLGVGCEVLGCEKELRDGVVWYRHPNDGGSVSLTLNDWMANALFGTQYRQTEATDGEGDHSGGSADGFRSTLIKYLEQRCAT